MKLYIGGKFEERKIIRGFIERAKAAGFPVTVDWTRHTKKSPGEFPKYAVEDIRGVADADVGIFYFKNQLDYKGSLVELGVCLGRGKPALLIGEGAEFCIFFYHPLVFRFNSFDECLDWLVMEREYGN